MGISGGDVELDPYAAALVRPLYRDDADGSHRLRLKRVRSLQMTKQEIDGLRSRLERGIYVAGASWGALVTGGEDGVQTVSIGGIPPAVHRELGILRVRQGDAESFVEFPAYIVKRAASLGFAVEGVRVGGEDSLTGYLVIGFPLTTPNNGRRRDTVRLIADDISGQIASWGTSHRYERMKNHFSLIHRLGQQVTSIHDRSQLFREITSLVHRSLGYEHIQLLLVDRANQAISLAHASGPFAEDLMREGYVGKLGTGIIGRVAKSRQPWISTDVRVDGNYVSHPLLPNTLSELALPICLGQRVIGVLDIQSDRWGAFKRDDVLLLQMIADQIAPAIEQHRLFAAERNERELSDTLTEVSRIVSSSLNLNQVLDAVLRELQRVVPFRGARVTLKGEDGVLRVVAADGYPDNEKVKRFCFRPEDAPLSEPVLKAHETLIIPDVGKEPQWVWQPGTEQVRSWCTAPLVFGNECVGWLCVDQPEASFYNNEHGRIVRAFADQAVVAIENARLFAKTRELSDALEQKVLERTVELREARDEVGRKADELRALWRRVVGVQEEERQRIAYDLHDSVTQSILAATYELHGIRRRVGNNADLSGRVADCQKLLDDTLGEMKQIIYALRPTLLDELGLVAALENHASSLMAHCGIGILLRVEGTPAALPQDVELAIFRIVQEACQNAVRHSGAQEVVLRLDFASERVNVIVHDNGCGFEEDKALPGLGLAGIRERAEAMAGFVQIKGGRGTGTEIILTVPRREPTNAH